MTEPRPDPVARLPRLRADLSIRRRAEGADTPRFEITDPVAGRSYEFDAQSFFLCQAFDGFSDADRITARFNAFHSAALGREDLTRFLGQLLELGLLEPDPAALAAFRARPDPARTPDTPADDTAPASGLEDEDESAAPDPWRWPLFAAGRLFAVLNQLFSPLRPLILLLVHGLIPGVPIALFMLFHNWPLINRDLALLGAAESYFGRMLLTLLLINLLRCLVQGTLLARYGGAPSTFGVRLRFGIIPRFFIDKRALRDLDRPARLWIHGSNLLLRLFLIVAGTLTWWLFRGTGTELAANAIVLTHSALIGLILVCLPVRASDGYRWLTLALRLPTNTIRLVVFMIRALLTRQPLPTSIAPRERRRLFVHALLLILFWTWLFARVVLHIASGLLETFPDLFGEATRILLITGVGLLALRWAFHKLLGSAPVPAATGTMPETPESTRARLWRRGLVALGLAVFLALPFPYRPGGEVLLLAPARQVIQAPFAGQVAEVFYRGGDGQPVAAGQAVARLRSVELEQRLGALREQIRQGEANLQQQGIELARLLAGARPEQIAGARAHVAEAGEEAELARRRLETARARALYSQRELDRIRELPKGLISELEIARSEKQAAVDRLTIDEEQAASVARQHSLARAEADLALLLAGATAETLAIARQEIAAAGAELAGLRREQRDAEDQIERGRLTMPFDGVLIDAYLDRKQGSYLASGATFATAEARRAPVVDLVLPEYDVPGIESGARAEIRLLAYPDRPFHGTVRAVAPSGTASPLGQTFQVTIALGDLHASVSAGMSGYGKIDAGTRPLYVLLTRPLLRFIAIEMWSWLL